VQASIATNATARKPIFNQKTPHFSPFFLYFRPKIGYNTHLFASRRQI
jgi:hypothetical protein